MPPQVSRPGDTSTTANIQAPAKVEEPKTAQVDKQPAEAPKLNPEIAAKNYEAARQHANDTKNQDSGRVQILKNQLAQKLPEKKMPTTDMQNNPGTPTQPGQTLKDQLAEKIAKGTDGPKILPDREVAQAGPSGPSQITANDTPSPVSAGPGVRVEQTTVLDPKSKISIRTSKGTENIPFSEYEHRWNKANDYVKGKASESLKPGEDGIERIANLRKEAAIKHGLQKDWYAARNEPAVMKAVANDAAKAGANIGGSGSPPVDPPGNTQPQVDPHANTQPRVDPHANTQPRVDPHANTQPRIDPYANTEAGATGKAAKVSEEGAVAAKAAGATEKAVSTGAKVVEGASTGVKVTSAAAKVGGAIAHMSPVLDGLMVELDYFTSYAKAHDIIRTRNTESGFAVGMAASLMGASPKNYSFDAIDRGVVTQVLGAEGIAEKSHNKGIYDGYKYAQSLSVDERTRLRDEAFKALSAKGYHTANPTSFDEKDVVHTAGVMLPGVKKLFEESRKAAEAEQLRNRKEKNPSYGSRF